MKHLLTFLNGIVSAVVGVVLLAGGAYAGYALWDNRQIYSAAEGVQLEMLRLKPAVVEAEEGEVVTGPSFAQLLQINPDVCAWVTVDNTNIDQPVLQGETNFVYINTNVYGEFALSGSIFMDVRCQRDCSDPYTLLYGHHMANHGMFGDLELFKDRAFFEANHTGTLLLPGESHPFHIVACIVTEASDNAIFDPQVWQEDLGKLAGYCQESALFVCDEAMDRFRERLETGAPRVIALSTCSDEYTNARTILLALLDEASAEKTTGQSMENNAMKGVGL